MTQEDLGNWGVSPDEPDESNTDQPDTPKSVSETTESTTQPQEEDNNTDILCSFKPLPDDEMLVKMLEHASELSRMRTEPIPFSEQYPAYHGRLRSENLCPHSINLPLKQTHSRYHYDDKARVEMLDENFAKIHYI